MIALLITVIQNLPTLIEWSVRLWTLYREAKSGAVPITVEQVKEVTSEIATAKTAEERQKVAVRIATMWSLRQPPSGN